MPNYALIDDVRMRGLPSPSPSDEEVEAALRTSKSIIDNWCGQEFESQENGTRYENGNDGDVIVTGYRISRIISLTVNDNLIPATSVILRPGDIGEIGLKSGYRFTRGFQNVVITADIGWSEVPAPVAEASAHLAAMILNRQLFSGRPELPELQSESLLDYSRRRYTASEIKGIIEQDPYLFELLRYYRIRGVKN